MADIPFPTSLLPQYQSPTEAALQGAQTNLIGQQVQGANLQNQQTALSLGLFKNYLANYGGGGTPPAGGQPGAQDPSQTGNQPSVNGTGNPQIGGTGTGSDDVSQHAFSRFAPTPTARPASVMQQMQAASMAGRQDLANMIGQQYDAQVAGSNQQKQLGATNAYLTAQSIADPNNTAPWTTLNRYNPDAAAALKAQYPDDSATQLDDDTRLYSAHVGAAVHQYTGRATDMQNGELIDKVDGKPVLGTNQVLTGLNAEDKQKAFDAATKLDTINQSDGSTVQIPHWQAVGAHSAESYVIAADHAARSSAAAPAVPGAAPFSNNLVTPPAAPKAAAPAAAPSSPQTSIKPTMPDGSPNPAYAYVDPTYKLSTQKPVSGASPSTIQAGVQKGIGESYTTLQKDSADATSTAAQSLTYLNAAKAVMASKGASTGAYGALIAKASSLMPGQSVDATNYQEVAKYLGNAALANAKATYGSRMTQSEVGLQMNELSPSVHMTPTAISNLIDANIRNAQYTIDSAGRVSKYLGQGGNPQQFEEWNQKYNPREKVVNATPKTVQADSGGFVPGQQYKDKNGSVSTYQGNGKWQ